MGVGPAIRGEHPAASDDRGRCARLASSRARVSAWSVWTRGSCESFRSTRCCHDRRAAAAPLTAASPATETVASRRPDPRRDTFEQVMNQGEVPQPVTGHIFDIHIGEEPACRRSAAGLPAADVPNRGHDVVTLPVDHLDARAVSPGRPRRPPRSARRRGSGAAALRSRRLAAGSAGVTVPSGRGTRRQSVGFEQAAESRLNRAGRWSR